MTVFKIFFDKLIRINIISILLVILFAFLLNISKIDLNLNLTKLDIYVDLESFEKRNNFYRKLYLSSLKYENYIDVYEFDVVETKVIILNIFSNAIENVRNKIIANFNTLNIDKSYILPNNYETKYGSLFTIFGNVNNSDLKKIINNENQLISKQIEDLKNWYQIETLNFKNSPEFTDINNINDFDQIFAQINLEIIYLSYFEKHDMLLYDEEYDDIRVDYIAIIIAFILFFAVISLFYIIRGLRE